MNLYKSLFCCAILLLTSSCARKDFVKRIGVSYDEVLDSRLDVDKSYDTVPISVLDWDEAYERLLKHNASYKQFSYSITSLEEEKKKLLITELSPSVYSFVGLSQGISSLANISSDDINARFVVSFRIPNPIHLYSKAYTYELQLYQMTQNLELTKRRLTVSLFNLFLRQAALAKQEVELREDEQKAKLLNPESQIKALISAKKKALDIEDAKKSHRIAINTLLGSVGGNWYLDYKSLPKVSYASKLDQMGVEDGFGLLALRISAVNLEASLLGLKRAKMDILPDFNIGINNPTLYSSDSSSSFALDPKEIDMYSSMSKSYRFDGSFSKNLKSAEDRVALTRQQLKLNMESENVRVEKVIATYRLLLEQKMNLETELALRKKQIPLSGAVDGVIAHWKLLDQIGESIEGVKRQLQQIDLEFWVWDDPAWSD
ncbi:hypothetical protein [Persicirhabdus sediminis]|uniref:Uncharacterized protein n=1 Tax=Persicirhabdus sediminis TaxID=454144 RepID=A0A8J7MB54_9BACT|nr:hypothetical protein [Persicirhabdus sediminis]MBK1789756.1 hypothetical protein [Persicirhabdus sediminis]